MLIQRRYRGFLIVSIVLFTTLFLSFATGYKIFGIDPDYFEYKAFWDYLSEKNPYHEIRFEPGFVLISWVAKYTLGSDLTMFIIAISIVSLLLKFYILSARPYSIILIAAYIPGLYLLHEMTQIRISLALAFGYFALEMYRSKKALWSIVFMGIAFTIQSSVALLCIAYFFELMRRIFHQSPRLALLVTAAISVLISTFAITLFYSFNPLLLVYQENQQQLEVSLVNARTLLLGTILALSAIYWKRICVTDYQYVAISLVSFLLFFVFQNTPVLAHRMIEISIFSYFLWITTIKGALARYTLTILVLLSLYEGYRMVFRDDMFT